MSDLLALSLKSFKCFDSTQIELAPITVLTGINAGGKTSILTALLLLKHAADAFELGEDPHWPINLGGIRVGAWETFSAFGSESECEISFDGAEAPTLHIAPGKLRFGRRPAPAFLKAPWRVCSTAHLPLCAEQTIDRRSLVEDKILDLRHALMEYLEYALRRKQGSLASEAPLPSVVESVLSSITSPTRVQLSRTEFAEKLRLMYCGTSIESEPTPPEQTGAGVTAALPVVTHLVAAVEGEVLILQDPESHLHPRGQSQVGREIARCASRGVRVVVETHSEHVLNGIKLGLLDLRKDPSKELACYYLDNVDGRTNVVRIDIDSRGLTRKWPTGFFDQAERDLADLARGRRGA